MARRYKNFLKGILGSLVFRELYGKQNVSTRPAKGTVKQTTDSIRSAGTFGMASSLSGSIRGAFKTPIGKFDDAGMVNRMNKQLIETLNFCRDNETLRYDFDTRSFDGLEGFDFNIKSPLSKSLGKFPDAHLDDGRLTVTAGASGMPLKLKFPALSTTCDITVSMMLFRLKENLKIPVLITQRITVKKGESHPEGLDFKFEVPRGCFCVVGLFLKYYSGGGGRVMLMNSKKFSPGGICAAIITPGIYENKDNREWFNMKSLKLDINS